MNLCERRIPLDIELLRTWRAISETGSTTGAAARLGLSQSAVSRRLGQLEQQLGIELFLRDRGRLLPTREARDLEAQMRLVLDHGSRLMARAQELATGIAASVTLRVAVPASMAQVLMPPILSEFQQTHERVQLELHFGAYDTIERMLLDERAEVGFLRLPVLRPGLTTMPVIEAQTVVVMPLGHPLSARAVVSISDLHGVPLILLGRMRPPRREIDAMFAEAGLLPQVKVEVHSVMSACALAAHGMGVTLVNALMAEDFRHLPIVIRPLREKVSHRFAWAVSQQQPPTLAAREFIRVASASLQAALKRAGTAGPGAETGAAPGTAPPGQAQT